MTSRMTGGQAGTTNQHLSESSEMRWELKMTPSVIKKLCCLLVFCHQSPLVMVVYLWVGYRLYTTLQNYPATPSPFNQKTRGYKLTQVCLAIKSCVYVYRVGQLK